ncbi:integrase arm-type DNA-binding domain-containing protein [Hydrogenophaga sp. 2FB]|uniref:tyrosine-type recombinase/integrase n=1 Tax=Hydrogenophaga sp. 2FB TaxID=2502187 RepID=UPI0010F43F71|nr:integrase arm-type DNA-binding domain-containing protein [Hydrogenophaga sp. 2FB]
MAKSVHLLNDIQLKAWMAKREAVAKSDGDGLTFTLSASGTATWVLRYRAIEGRRRELTIGNYPDIGLSAAREKARAHRVAIDEGRDPGAEKGQEKVRAMAAWSVRDLVADLRDKVLVEPAYAAKTIKYRLVDFDQVILPKLGARRVDSITPVDIVAMIESAKRTWTISKRLITSASKLFEHAVGRQIIPANPCTGIQLSAIKGPRPPIRKRLMLDQAELRVLLRDTDAIGRENSLALLILLATCVRGIELVKARKEHLDLERGTWWVPDESVKTRAGFLVPLVPVVVEWFRELLALSGDSEFVLPARTEKRLREHGGDTHVGETTLWAAIARAFDRNDLDIRRFTPHDTRSTAKGHMRNMGISREISEIALNHKLQGMEGIYDVREEIPERRAALAKWAAFLVACQRSAPASRGGKVVALRRAA